PVRPGRAAPRRQVASRPAAIAAPRRLGIRPDAYPGAARRRGGAQRKCDTGTPASACAARSLRAVEALPGVFEIGSRLASGGFLSLPYRARQAIRARRGPQVAFPQTAGKSCAGGGAARDATRR